MTEPSTEPSSDALVPADVIPPGTLPPLRYRDMPEPVPIRRMIGPSIILAGLALGSGEYILWPYITYKSQFVFFWACLLGVVTQYFMNMEIVRWTLATGESAMTGFIRLSKHWAWVFLFLNVIPWLIPAWSKGAAQIVSWLIWPPQYNEQGQLVSYYVLPLSIAGMLLCGTVLTLGPVIYETVEWIQKALVTLIIVIVVVLAAWLAVGRPDAIMKQVVSTVTFGAPRFLPPLGEGGLDIVTLLGALAFAGAGGTMNLGQSNYIKDKGYGMGQYIGRITSPITGQEETISEIGYHFAPSAENMRRWRRWWRSASIEHFFSFLMTCVVCLVLLTFISYVLFYDSNGELHADAAKYKDDMNFIWGEANLLIDRIGTPAKFAFLVCGIAILMTTELGVLDAASRISTDIVKTAWLRKNEHWSLGRLYYLFLWGSILIGSGILLLDTVGVNVGTFGLFKLTAAMNGFVMCVYSAILLYMNRRCLPASVRMSRWRAAVLVWTVLFFGFFAVWTGWSTLRDMTKAKPASGKVVSV